MSKDMKDGSSSVSPMQKVRDWLVEILGVSSDAGERWIMASKHKHDHGAFHTFPENGL
ncbi:hypothetical protein HDU67_008246 [Dinochytrium kinnereticum]|nr:hypothetical protein HDU67_008246 [Dinochytrium kinnereticum]